MRNQKKYYERKRKREIMIELIDLLEEYKSMYPCPIPIRPVGIAFNQNEDALYIASIGKVEVRTTLPNNNDIRLPEPVPWYYPNTGAIWKITKIPR
jgi:hypothetical protein